MLLLLLAAACSRDSEARKAAYLASGDRYAQQGALAEALIEYRNAVQVQPEDGEVRLKLAQAHWKAGDVLNAAGEYVRAADQLPGRVDVQLRAGNLLLLSGRFDDAKVRADKALAVSPEDAEAYILLANALAGLKQPDAAIAGIEEAIRLAPESGVAYASLGALEIGRGQYDAAERAFKKAVEIDRASAAPHLASANFYWARQRWPEAEGALKQAVQVHPQNVLAHRALARLLFGLGKPAEAEVHLKEVVAITNSPEAILTLADFHMALKDYSSARTALQSMRSTDGAAADANVRLAALDHAEGKKEDGYERLEKVLAAEPTHLQALVTKSGMLLADGDAANALISARLAVKSHPDVAPALLALARAEQARNQPDAASAAYGEVLRINPRATTAQVGMAQLHLNQGRMKEAVTAAENALESDPSNPDARLALIRGLTATNDLGRAETELLKLVARFPNSAAVREQNGKLLARKKDFSGARREFERAMQLAPDSVAALEGLVALDLAANEPDQARTRVKRAVWGSDASPSLLMLGARTYIATNDPKAAEELLIHLHQRDPAYLPAYTTLGQLYMKQQRLDEALTQFEYLVERDPKPSAALTTAGLILQRQGKQAQAQQRFERALQVDPTAPIAANNLAWIYANSGGNLDVALQLAQTAYAKLPNNPEVSDTLGFIYYKKALFPQAVQVLKTTVEKDSANPLFHYHLGLALAESGEAPAARRHLRRALELKPDFAGATEARAVLHGLEAQ